MLEQIEVNPPPILGRPNHRIDNYLIDKSSPHRDVSTLQIHSWSFQIWMS